LKESEGKPVRYTHGCIFMQMMNWC